MTHYTLNIEWARQGKKDWEWWWILLRGKKTTREPNRADHISFANFDLQKIGVSKISSNGNDLYLYRVPGAKLDKVSRILGKHGFEVIGETEEA